MIKVFDKDNKKFISSTLNYNSNKTNLLLSIKDIDNLKIKKI